MEFPDFWSAGMGRVRDVFTRRTLPKLLVTLCPSFGHFEQFAKESRLSGIRLNSAMLSPDEVEKELAIVCQDGKVNTASPLYFDVKGRQLRIAEVLDNPEYLDVRMNHPITVETPNVVLLKAGSDAGMLGEVSEDGYRLTFSGNPHYSVRVGESIHIRHPSFKMIDTELFSDVELEKIDRVRKAGINRWFLSYVEEQRDIDLFREIVGKDAELMLKIESKRGLQYVEREFKKDEFTRLVAACGDMYVELDHPHEILDALPLIISKDPEAVSGSRLLLSIVYEPVPSFADLAQLAWIHNIGFDTMMLCDELCLKPDSLATAVNVFEAFKTTRHGSRP